MCSGPFCAPLAPLGLRCGPCTQGICPSLLGFSVTPRKAAFRNCPPKSAFENRKSPCHLESHCLGGEGCEEQHGSDL